MNILETKVYRGANYWANVPVIRFSLTLGGMEANPILIPGLHDKLTTALPNLHEHRCHTSGNFLSGVREGTSLNHIAQHIAVELQTMVGQTIGGHRTCLATYPKDETQPGTNHVIFPYQEKDVGVAAGQLAVRLLESFVDPEHSQEFDVRSELNEFFRFAACLSYGPSTRALVAEAKRRNIPVQRLDYSRDRVQLGRGTRALRSLLQLGYGKYQRRIWAPYISTESHLAAEIALNKDLTYRLVQHAGLPVPQAIKVNDEEAAVAAAREIGYPVVLKPLDGNHGRGVGVNLQGEAAVRAHYPIARGETHTGTVLVEKFISGNTYRVLVVGGRAVAVTEEVPAHVIGDGSHTLRQLVSLTNADPRRGHGSENLLVRIRLDQAAIAMAREQGCGPDDVPPAGKRVQLVRTAHISLGGISVDHTDEVHPYNAMIAEQAAQVVGLQVAGIDLIAPDISQSVRETGGAICEVNAGPGLGLHIEPVEGKPRDVARPVLELLFPPGAISRVPIIAVTGSGDNTATSRLIAHILQASGRRVGLATKHGMYLDNSCIVEADMRGPDSARLVLRNPAIESAVLEIGYEGLLCSGLGYDFADVAVITQISDVHPRPNSMDLDSFIHLNSVVATALSSGGQVVLNADDERCLDIAKTTDQVIYFSVHASNAVVEKHVQAGGRAVVLGSDSSIDGIFLVDPHGPTLLLSGDILPDDRSRSITANLLAAAGACSALGIDADTIRQASLSLPPEHFGFQHFEQERHRHDQAPIGYK